MSVVKNKFPYKNFRIVFDMLDGKREPEFELDFAEPEVIYGINKFQDCVSICKECSNNEIFFPNIDELYENADIEGFKLKDVWENLQYLLVNDNLPWMDFEDFCEERHIKFDDGEGAK